MRIEECTLSILSLQSEIIYVLTYNLIKNHIKHVRSYYH